MPLFRDYLQNARFPADSFGGHAMLAGMNFGHYPLYRYALACCPMRGDESVLDIGCGGGRFIKMLVKRTSGRIMGIDYSPQSIAKTRKLNSRAIRARRVKALQADVASLPVDDGMFDLVTAVETIYFWPDFPDALTEVRRVMRPGARLLIANEIRSIEAGKKWSDMLEMTIYEPDILTGLLHGAGFADIGMHLHPNGHYMVAVAVNPAR